MPINDEVQLARPLEPMYALTTWERNRDVHRKPHSEAYNRGDDRYLIVVMSAVTSTSVRLLISVRAIQIVNK